MKLGFIGMGNMAGALLRGFLACGKIETENVFVFDKNAEKLEKERKELEFNALSSEKEVAEHSDIVIMACKPYHVEGAILAMGNALCDKALLSIALGWDHTAYRAVLPENVREIGRAHV